MKTILITGANRGLGLALAKQYQQDDWRVLATCRRPEAANELNALGLKPLELDVTGEASRQALQRELDGEPIDILFNNAGVTGPRGTELADLDADAWLEVLTINVIAPTLVAQALQANVASSEDKLLVFMSSGMGSLAKTTGNDLIYRSSKAALNMVGASLAKELEPQGIRSVLMNPGWVRTDMGGENANLSPETSASGMKAVLDGLPKDVTGVFVNHDGSSIPW